MFSIVKYTKPHGLPKMLVGAVAALVFLVTQIFVPQFFSFFFNECE